MQNYSVGVQNSVLFINGKQQSAQCVPFNETLNAPPDQHPPPPVDLDSDYGCRARHRVGGWSQQQIL